MSTRTLLHGLTRLALFAWLFFLSIEAMGGGMKASFKEPLKAYLHEHAAEFTELMSFVIGILGTSLVQSSSTVTSMSVVMTQEGIVPLLIAIGIVHGANLGTSVTSSLVAFAAETRALPRNPIAALRVLLFAPRLPGFRRAVSTAVVHGMFNAVLVTLILLTLELPFGVVRELSAVSAAWVGASLAGSDQLLHALEWVAPKTWTAPVVDGALALGVPGWAIVIAGFGLLFAALRGFARTMSMVVLNGTSRTDLAALGERLVGRHPLDTFARGLFLTILVQSSSATTSMVVPLAAMGLFNVRRILPFILGANIGTTTTALLAAASAVGQPGFEAGLTIALSHFYLNTLAVLLVVAFPWLRESVLGATEWLAGAAERSPAALLGYLCTLAFVIPVAVYALPNAVAIALVAATLAALLVAPHLRRPAMVSPLDTGDPDDEGLPLAA